MKIGVLSLQGSFREHMDSLERCGVKPVSVKYPSDLEGISGIILPGGESTTLGKLLHKQSLMEPLRARIAEGMPVYGTCAGMILLAREIEGQDEPHLGVMDISVQRNAYGSQLESFTSKEKIDFMHDVEEVEMVFIRAPIISGHGEGVESMKLGDSIVAAKQDNMLATSFHPELTSDLTVHRYFIDSMCSR
jgi:pyridoxal 5'-phosphate synthase pdxT subunit